MEGPLFFSYLLSRYLPYSLLRLFLLLLPPYFPVHSSSSGAEDMGLLLPLLVMMITVVMMSFPSSTHASPPSPGYWPSTKFRSMSFYQGFTNLWGPQHQSIDQNYLKIWLDRTSGISTASSIYIYIYMHHHSLNIYRLFFIQSSTGSGFKSVKPFRSGYFGASIKLQTGYTAGVITAFYVGI